MVERYRIDLFSVSLLERLREAKFVVDAEGNRAAAIIDYALWEELLEMLEDVEDEGELQRLREEGQDALSWGEAKMHINLD